MTPEEKLTAEDPAAHKIVTCLPKLSKGCDFFTCKEEGGKKLLVVDALMTSNWNDGIISAINRAWPEIVVKEGSPSDGREHVIFLDYEALADDEKMPVKQMEDDIRKLNALSASSEVEKAGKPAGARNDHTLRIRSAVRTNGNGRH